jgi:cation diffusion facilitator CzcD-associated flavoprotein CzcO
VLLDGQIITARAIVVATGEDRVPVMPEVPGIAVYRPPLSHSSEARDLTGYSGQTVLVVGAGTSGGELATRIAQDRTAEVLLSVRTRPVLLPRQVLGIPTAWFGAYAARAPSHLLDGIGQITTRAMCDPRNLELVEQVHNLSERRTRRYAPTVCEGLKDAIRDGRIRVVRSVSAFTESEVELSDGSMLRPHTVVAATGYQPCLGPLVGHLGVLDRESRPLPPDRLLVVAPGLHFVGLRPRVEPLLRAVRREAHRIARAIASHLLT